MKWQIREERKLAGSRALGFCTCLSRLEIECVSFSLFYQLDSVYLVRFHLFCFFSIDSCKAECLFVLLFLRRRGSRRRGKSYRVCGGASHMYLRAGSPPHTNIISSSTSKSCVSSVEQVVLLFSGRCASIVLIHRNISLAFKPVRKGSSSRYRIVPHLTSLSPLSL